jgi:hypothetical protein
MKWKQCSMMVLVGLSATVTVPAVRGAEAPAPAVVGGYAPASVKDKQVKAAADAAVKTETLVLHEDRLTRKSTLKLVSIESAEQQVVAGINYRLRLKVKLDGKVREAEAVVWWQSWRKPEAYRLTAWSWK